tara:strand:- start:312 stop:545 length:234 start_codon:yes stop_codon:yes gene_type:complete
MTNTELIVKSEQSLNIKELSVEMAIRCIQGGMTEDVIYAAGSVLKTAFVQMGCTVSNANHHAKEALLLTLKTINKSF